MIICCKAPSSHPNAFANMHVGVSRRVSRAPLKKPDVDEQQEDKGEEAQPHSPSDTSPLGHSQHAVHRPAESIPCAFEVVIHLFGEGGAVANLAANGDGDLAGPSAGQFCIVRISLPGHYSLPSASGLSCSSPLPARHSGSPTRRSRHRCTVLSCWASQVETPRLPHCRTCQIPRRLVIAAADGLSHCFAGRTSTVSHWSGGPERGRCERMGGVMARSSPRQRVVNGPADRSWRTEHCASCRVGI